MRRSSTPDRAPYPYWRKTPDPQHTAERVVSDAELYLQFLAELPEASGGRIGVVGYCIGGLVATRTGGRLPRPGQWAFPAFHGPVGADEPKHSRKSPHRVVSAMQQAT
ncbi:dienelactone hydrolase family protein [Rhodococcus sp. 1163]|uniref:dienelactone hydrolase family protein n=1 Tax=Rhodococcus sp. 1163 TaxID=1905289 RepID=UPI00356B6BEC